jgi:Lipocalin-like domain
MNAYTGTYTIEGDKWTTMVDLHRNEIYIGTPQVRFFKVDDNELSVRVPEQPSAVYPGKMVTATLEWVRER